ncbi:MAG: SpoIIIAC/SpoIIIAD family protein [bacterium]
MEMEVIIKLAGLGIILAIMNVILNQAGKGEYAQILTLVGVAIGLGVAVTQINKLLMELQSIFTFRF